MKLKEITVTSTGEMEIASKIFYISVQMRRKILQQNKLILDLFLLLDKLFNQTMGKEEKWPSGISSSTHILDDTSFYLDNGDSC